MVIGLTGGSGCGKTTALLCLQRRGALLLDCDALYYRLLLESSPMLAEIEARFPGSVQDGVLLRKQLGARVFGDPEALKELSAITHRYVAADVKTALSRQPSGALAAIDAIALFESGLSGLCDHTVAVTAPKAARIARLMAREGISEAYAAARIDAQKTNEEFSALCEFTLENNGTEAEFSARCRNLFETLIKGET